MIENKTAARPEMPGIPAKERKSGMGPGMAISELKHILAEEVDRIESLIAHLSDAGSELPLADKHLIREILSRGWMRMIFNETRLFFAEGQDRDVRETFTRISEIMAQLS